MARIRQVFLFAVILCLFGEGFTGQGVYAQMPVPITNQFTQPDTANSSWQIDQTIPDTYEMVAENTQIQLYANKTSLGFKVVDKRSGYVWHSSLDAVGPDDRLNKSWQAFAASGISIDYLDQKATKKRISITNSKTTVDFKPIDQGFEAAVTFTDFSISVGVVVRLEDTGASVEVPFTSIKEQDPKFKLGMVYVYPFLGATRADTVPGYMFIPDGAGSLIRFQAETKAKNMLYSRYYGADLGMVGEVPWDWHTLPPYRISIPVFGMVHGYKQNAFLSIVEKGAAYGELQVHPSGVITNFNFLYSAFVYNESFFQATNRSGAGVTTIQRNTNAFDVKIHYRFLTGQDSDYVGMARSYQQYLVDQGRLKKTTAARGDIGARLEFLGGEREKVLFWHRSIPMTTVSQMGEILADLNIPNPEVIYYGWQPLGASTMPPRTVKLESSLGSQGELRSLAEKIASDGGNFYLYYDPQAAMRGEGGYSPRNDLAMSITDVNLLGFTRSLNYYLNIDALSRRYATFSKDAAAKGKFGLALDGFGSILFSDFKNNHFLNREDAIQRYQQVLADSPAETAFYLPNDYMYPFVKSYFDIPLASSGYIYTTDAVPFLQIVLSGYVPYYGPALNFSSNYREDLLRQVDFGVYPSYFLTQEPTARILDTPSNWIYSSSYQQWGQEIQQTYQWMDSLLKPVIGQAIVARDVLQPGVVATTYANGMQILVNYNEQPYSAGGVTIAAQDAVAREVQP